MIDENKYDLAELNHTTKPWWNYLEEDLKELVDESFLLLAMFDPKKIDQEKLKFHDYSFVVFPIAKAYEGFLKRMFMDLGFITKEDYYGSRFRIGKALNPSLEERYRDESIYDRIVNYCGGKETADKLWITWKDARNAIFHWFPDEKRAINYDEARIKIYEVIEAIDQAFSDCDIKSP